MAAVIRQWYVNSVPCHLVYCRADPEPRTYLHLRGGVGVMLRLLISSAALQLGEVGDYPSPTGVLPTPGVEALRAEVGFGLAGQAPLGGQPFQVGNYL